MNTLEDAWEWYKNTRNQLRLVRRLGERYWDDLPWDKGLGGDRLFQELAGDKARAGADLSLLYLDDLAVVVLFSVFESMVRLRVLAEVEGEAAGLRHRALKLAAEEMTRRIAEGGFFHVLEPFKDLHADLVEEVHQVRRYRNWVAHGRKGDPQNNVTPETAFARLTRFLNVLSAPGPGPST